MILFSSPDNSYLGVDVGSSSIKLVELKRDKGKLRLMSYGFTENLGELIKDDWQQNAKRIAKIIKHIIEKSGAGSKSAVAALPTFSVFSSVVNLSQVKQKDISSAVYWEAKKVIPLPIDEMVLDWKVLSQKDNENTKVLLTGAPKTLVKRYVEIFKEAHINLLSLETETFSLIRSLLGNDKATIMLLEIGMSTTDISIVENGIPILNRSIDVGGLSITKAISNNLNIGLKRAEQFKYDLGITSLDSQEDVVPKTIMEAINPVVNEAKYMINLFQNSNNKKVIKIVLSGGASLLPNLTNYLSKILNINVIVGDPWSRISCPVELKPTLTEIGPRLSVAIGLAMREFE